MTRITAAVVLTCALIAPALAYTDDEYMSMSRQCEAATVRASGDVDQPDFYDCMQWRRVRPNDERVRNNKLRPPDPTWQIGLHDDTHYGDTERRCVSWANDNLDRPSPPDSLRGAWSQHLWNVCMRREGIFR